MPLIQKALPLLALVSMSAFGAASNPDALATALQKALDAGDFAAAAALADVDGAPADARFAYFDAVSGCSADMQCKVKVAPLDDDFRKGLAEDANAIDATPIAAEGVVVVTETSRDGSGSGDLRMPYVKSGGAYRIALMRPGAPAIAKARTRSNDDILKSFLAAGIYDPATRTRRTDWASAAKALPADGGDAGRAFVASTKAMSAAVDAKDPDAAMRAGGRWSAIVFADKGFDGKPVAKAERQKKLFAQSQRMLRDVKVSGGYQLGDDAALVFEARNGSGWIERGAVLLTKEGDT
ncbi:MAG TPA: hypothetical protein VKB52_01360, partial [Rhodanobacteraceae bacterium]|nr:hypothetical protein [Rhodanobacteraceae bacterium]